MAKATNRNALKVLREDYDALLEERDDLVERVREKIDRINRLEADLHTAWRENAKLSVRLEGMNNFTRLSRELANRIQQVNSQMNYVLDAAQKVG